jgi:hypothetical protein
MNKLLEKHQKIKEENVKYIRFQNKDIVMYEPVDEQRQEIKNFILENSQTDFSINEEAQVKLIRLIIREHSNIGAEIDEYTNSELQEKLNNGDRTIILLLREVSTLVDEIVEDISYEYLQQIKIMNSMFNIMNNNQELNTLKIKVNKFLKKNKINMQFEDFMNIQNDPQVLQELVNKISIKTK